MMSTVRQVTYNLGKFRPIDDCWTGVPRHVWKSRNSSVNGVEAFFSAKLQNSLLDK